MSEDWRRWPKVVPPRHGQANTKRYRRVKYWQPPQPQIGDCLAMGYACLGSMAYAGPMRSTRYMDRGRFHRLRGAYLVAWWHADGELGRRGI